MELLPPPQGGVACVIPDHEGAPPSGIEVVNAVEDLAQDEVEREGEQPVEFVPSANVNDTNHPKVAPSYDEELAQVQRQCDKLKEALSFEKEQRRTIHYTLITRTKGNFELQKEINRLQKENGRLASLNPSEEDRFMEGEVERARKRLMPSVWLISKPRSLF